MYKVAMSLLARDIARMSYLSPMAMLVTSEARSSVVDHFLDNSKASSPSTPLSYRLVQRQNFPLLLPRINPLEKGQIAVTMTLSILG